MPCSEGLHSGSNFSACRFITHPEEGTPPRAYTVEEYRCLSEIDPGPGEGGGGSTGGGGSSSSGSGGDDNDDTTPCSGNGVLREPQQPGITDPNGCNTGIPTIPTLPNPKTDPCVQLSNLGKKDYFKNNMTELNNNVENGTVEKGFVLHNDATTPASYIISGSSNNDSNSIDFSAYYSTLSNAQAYSMYGNAHNHLKNDPKHIGVFTPDDLPFLAAYGLIETDPQNPVKSLLPVKSIIFVTTDKGFFALKIKDLDGLKAFVIKYGNWSRNKVDEYMDEVFQDPDVYNIRHESTYEEQVSGFLRFIQDESIGIELYEGNKTTMGDWKKLELLNNGTFGFKKTPCNL